MTYVSQFSPAICLTLGSLPRLSFTLLFTPPLKSSRPLLAFDGEHFHKAGKEQSRPMDFGFVLASAVDWAD